MGAIVAELLTVHQDSYAVRALVQLGGTPFASGMATALDIEAAEDQAKVRALQAFGIGQTSGQRRSEEPPAPFMYLPQELPAPVSAITTSYEAMPATAPLAQPSLVPSISEISSASETPSVSSTPLPDLSLASELPQPFSLSQPAELTAPVVKVGREIGMGLDMEDDLPLLSAPSQSNLSPEAFEAEAFEAEAPKAAALPSTPAPLKSDKPAKRKAEPLPEVPAESSAEGGDRSNEIARIGVEMKRLGWTTEQGRTYLRRTYGKRSRQELNDSELMSFLSYLEAQPSPSASPF